MTGQQCGQHDRELTTDRCAAAAESGSVVIIDAFWYLSRCFSIQYRVQSWCLTGQVKLAGS